MLLITIKNHQLINSQIHGYLHLMYVSKEAYKCKKLIFVGNCTRTESSWIPISPVYTTGFYIVQKSASSNPWSYVPHKLSRSLAFLSLLYIHAASIWNTVTQPTKNALIRRQYQALRHKLNIYAFNRYPIKCKYEKHNKGKDWDQWT